MATISKDEAIIRSSGEAARAFTDWYYTQLTDGKPIASAYVNSNAKYLAASHPPADICINGQVIATPEEWDALLEQQRLVPFTQQKGKVKYEVEGFDVHVINKDYRFAAPAEIVAATDPKLMQRTEDARLMMVVTVAGSVTFGAGGKEKGTPPKQHFSDVFVLVPNWDYVTRPKFKGHKRYLVASHTYRAY
ncbi:hypothetical protein B0H65DRAFT_456015 [Neurospora tetraspora]|uniref:NTF2 domain-containing protein n=1 Tax=Neurospora tetraspora TaxID=94610 RepID=A0AAE0JJJ1_9PEZI|nr:hypothetical protein B0H65DRAFT_456015 [Neurospora tetraspora]